MLVEKMLLFKLPAAHSIRIPTGEALLHSVLLGRAAIFGHEKYNGLWE